jgi:hypothetical protein
MAGLKGSVESRGQHRWRLEVTIGGQKYRKTITAEKERDARKELAEFVAEVESK